VRLQVLTATGFRSLSICPSTAGITRPRGRATDESPHFRQGQQTCFSPKHQQHLWGSSSALFDWYRWICSQGQSSRGIEITIHIGLVRGLRMSGAVPLLLPGLHRNSYTFTAFFFCTFLSDFIVPLFWKRWLWRKLANEHLRDLAVQYLEARVDVCLLPCSVLSCHGCLHIMRFLLFCFVVRTIPLNKTGTRLNTCWLQNICTAAEFWDAAVSDRNSGFHCRHKSS